MQCLKCGNEIEKPATGRPPRYCSRACRRTAEYEIRRITRRLEKLEERRDDESELVDAQCSLGDMAGRGPAERLAAVEKLILGAETRLKELLGAADD